LIKGLTQLRRLFKSWRLARVALLLAMVISLCVGSFLSLLPTGLEGPAALVKAHSPQVNQGTNGEWHPLDASCLAVSAEEAEKHPVNAHLLSALLLVALCFWASVVWSLAHGWWHRASRSLGLGRSFVSTLEDRPFLSVFRL
jgi:hypothetical protein